MQRSILVLHAMTLLLLPSVLEAGSKLAGSWVMTSVSVQVNIESWGDYCGTRPKSHSQQMKKPVTIQDMGGHLVLSEGIRTDRCGSPNPRIETVLARRTEVRWRRECQTPADDPKFERGVYTLNAVNNNRIEYTAQSRFDWTLKGDHCVATAHELRVFIRAQKKGASQPADQSPLPVPEPIEDDTSDTCVDVGPISRFELVPDRAKVGPGERFCFRVVANDNKGCPIKGMNLHWGVMQDGVEIEGLVTRAGCFKAGETAAESEGLYDVTVRFGAHTANAQISVLFEDLGDLFAARLSPLADVGTTSTLNADPTAEKKKTKEESNSASDVEKNGPTSVAPIVPRPEKRNTLVWVILLLVIVAGIMLSLSLLIGRIRRQTTQEVSDEFEDWPDLDEDNEVNKEKKHDDKSSEKNNALICPECGRIYKRNAKYCAYDKTTLISISKTPMEIPEGMICPRCHRGYEKDARFCPHDSEPLVPYSDWRSTKKPNSKV